MSRLFLCAKKRKGNGQGSGMIGASFEEGEVLFMKICAHCGNAMMDEAKFCVNCGTQANGYRITRINRNKIAIFLIIAKCLGKILE